VRRDLVQKPEECQSICGAATLAPDKDWELRVSRDGLGQVKGVSRKSGVRRVVGGSVWAGSSSLVVVPSELLYADAIHICGDSLTDGPVLLNWGVGVPDTALTKVSAKIGNDQVIVSGYGARYADSASLQL
jgi:hypothetical protein